jgi:hypothetical protein
VNFQNLSQGKQSVLLVIDDANMLMMARASLSQTRRVLLAWDEPTALWSLRNVSVDSVVIREGMPGFTRIETECYALGLRVHTMRGAVEDGIVRLVLPEFAARPLAAMAASSATCVM